MAFGLTETGFVAPSVEELRDGTNKKLWSVSGPSLDLSDGSILGQFVGILSERLGDLWELGEHVNSSMDPDQATGPNLDALCALTGTIRLRARPSTTTLTLTGTPLTVVRQGSRASAPLSGAEFATLADATIQALGAWAPLRAYALGARITNSGKAYVCTVAGTSAVQGGPTAETSAVADGSVVWRFVGTGSGTVDVDAQALTTGPTVAVSGAITEIKTPFSGWQGVVNLLDARVGRNDEKDEELRVRRVGELAASGARTRRALRAVLQEVAGVTAVSVFVNNSDATDPDGMPPNTVEALVQGGNNQDLWDALQASVADGIKTHGNTPGTAKDSQETVVPVAFSRPVEVLIYIVVHVIVELASYPLDGNAAVAASIVTWGNSRPTGRDAVASAISAQAFRVDGVLNVTAVFLGTSPAPTSSATVPISLRQLAVYDTSRVVVTSTGGVP